MRIKIGDKCPDFQLFNQNGDLIRISNYFGQKILVVYFYPKDNTWGCTKQACSFRDVFDDFLDVDCEVIGISSDSIASHKSFAEHHQLKFNLLADQKDEVRKLFGVPTNFFGLIKGRVTYLIDKDGVVFFVFNSQLNPKAHIQKVIAAIKNYYNEI